jgi:ATP-dependent helicase/nuclease subunit A
VVYRWLPCLAAAGGAGWDAGRIHALDPAIRLALAAQGVGESVIADAAARARQALINCVSDDRGRWLLGAQVEGRSEWRLTGVVDGQRFNVIIDRTFVDEAGVRWIIDYKTSVHTGADTAAFLDNERERYRSQLERYAALLRGAQRIRLGLYFPLLCGWREWEYGTH